MMMMRAMITITAPVPKPCLELVINVQVNEYWIINRPSLVLSVIIRLIAGNANRGDGEMMKCGRI